jgi:hypothetical protein
MRALSVAVSVLVLGVSLSADDSVVKFNGGIGVNPVSRFDVATGTVVRNVVRGVNPGGQPWVIDKLEATVTSNGRITAVGKGLLLSGGDRIGTNGNQSVKAMLFCGTTSFTSDAVPLDASGDFRIDGFLSDIPPTPCADPALLIVSGGGNWFAAGIPKQ